MTDPVARSESELGQVQPAMVLAAVEPFAVRLVVRFCLCQPETLAAALLRLSSILAPVAARRSADQVVPCIRVANDRATMLPPPGT